MKYAHNLNSDSLTAQYSAPWTVIWNEVQWLRAANSQSRWL